MDLFYKNKLWRISRSKIIKIRKFVKTIVNSGIAETRGARDISVLMMKGPRKIFTVTETCARRGKMSSDKNFKTINYDEWTV